MEDMRMPILRDRNGIFYEIPERELKKYAVPPKKVKQILKKESVASGRVGGAVGACVGAPMRPSTIVINLGPPPAGAVAGKGVGGPESAEVSSYSSSACWRRSCGCWRRSCSCKK